MVFGSRSVRFQEKCAFTHFYHILALLVDLKQGNNKPRWTFSFRSEKERKSAIYHKIRFWPPRTLLILEPNWWFTKCTFCDDFLIKIFSRKITFRVLNTCTTYFMILGGQNRPNAFFQEKCTFSAKIQNVQILRVAYGFWEAILGHCALWGVLSAKVPPCGPRGSESLTAGLPPPPLTHPKGGGGFHSTLSPLRLSSLFLDRTAPQLRSQVAVALKHIIIA